MLGDLADLFVFKRGHATRGNAKTLFATIAYQLALAVPWLRASIFKVVENDPSVVVRSIATQMQMLISDPCRAEARRDAVTILIDGLDECEGHDTQEEILRAIWNSSCAIPLRFIVASRPEPHITEVFESSFYSGRYRPVNVEQSFRDVRKYLQDEFTRIRLQHRTMVNIPSPWPSLDVLEDLVEKSSGHFIYAATIIKFIDDKNYRPTQRLTVVQDGNSAGSASPFGGLDQLYMTILDSSPRQAELIPILCVIVNLGLDLRQVEQLFELEAGEVRLLLRGLHSVVHVPSEDYHRIFSHHASFVDFLKNRSRSHRFWVDNLDHRMAVARCILQQLAGSNWRIVYGGDIGRHLEDLILFLIALPPSAKLCPLIARMDPDCIFRQPSSNIRSMLSWLREIPSAPENLTPAPEDLINMWEDYLSMSRMGNDDIWFVKHVLSPSSELCRVLVAAAFLGVNIWAVRYLLEITWTEFRIILNSVRPNIASDVVLRGSADHVTRALVPPELQRAAFRELALKCIHKVIKRHVDGVDDGNPWFYLALVLEHCPPCDILYREFQCIPIHAMQSAISQWGIAFYRISRWLKSFNDPTLELIALWTRKRPPLNPPPLPRRKHYYYSYIKQMS
ncbi:NACHT domain-containing protein [Mycena sanguinolenta]|uniref:NACHT domain-containing protein n=1 Tax=Mycena sanguinolenta TaxID=230812 RepID=A0A8H6ZBW0_9AGAR|nr:NACHT domain-containing protein [Mycena sanguinolenta]